MRLVAARYLPRTIITANPISPVSRANMATASESPRPRSPARIPGPLETSMQTKVSLV